MKNYPFYLTWTAQNNALKIDIKGSKGPCYITNDGRKLYDLSSTSYQAAFGHSYKPIKDAIKKQLNTLPISSPKGIFDLKEDATKKLLSLINLPGKIFYTTSGAESVENALKIARQITGKNIVLARENSYHGATLGALSITGDWRNKDHQTVSKWTKRIPDPIDDPKAIALEKLILKVGAEKIAAICLETFVGGNGVFSAPKSWWNALNKLKKKYNFLIILDEVVSGFGRTGKAFGFQHFSIRPDIICMAKIITGGYIPFGALWTTKKISKVYDTKVLSCGLTNYAHPLGLAAMSAVIDDITSDQFKINFSNLELKLIEAKDKLSQLSTVSDVRQVGLLMAVDLKTKPAFEKFIEQEILVAIVGQRLIIAPPYTMTPAKLKSLLNRVYNILKEKDEN
ncbi:aminotransferase class III-fold pyridoxal phosphate-dependent enzyme [Halobacteriovorax sp.]|uniref:aminotransferase class III-fold pyridoxal phosphate-dependent enzyme n=1 Tax=Halobacteriovorax sp. TaxID=2020862 RepID=UPI003561757B